MSTTVETPSTPAAAPQTGTASLFTLTARAVQQVKDVMKQQGFDGYFLTVRVVPAGCSGLGYDLNLIKETKAGDLVWEQEGVRIATDKESYGIRAPAVLDIETRVDGKPIAAVVSVAIVDEAIYLVKADATPTPRASHGQARASQRC